MKNYLDAMGITELSAIYRNLTPAELTERALARGEGKLANNGALVIKTGKYTGRSPNDRFIVDTPDIHNQVDWGKINMPIERAKADSIYGKMCAYMQNREAFVVDAFVGADDTYSLPSVWCVKTPPPLCSPPRRLCAPPRSSSIISSPNSPCSAAPASSASPSVTAPIPKPL